MDTPYTRSKNILYQIVILALIEAARPSAQETSTLVSRLFKKGLRLASC
jgi:hypothetical protein